MAIDSDMAPGIDFDRLQIDIRQQGAERLTKTFREFGQPGQEVHFPATYTIVSNGRPETRIQLRVVTGKTGPGGGPDVGLPQNLVEVITAVPTDRTAVLRVRLEWLCRRSTKLEPDGYAEGACAEGSSCVAGKCQDWNVDVGALPNFVSSEVFGGGSEQGEGACFDTVACFSGARVVTLDAACSFSDSDAEKLNVALVPAKGDGGICAGDTCFVPLDRGAPHGWTSDGGCVSLPPRVCELVKSPEPGLGLRGVVVSHTCATKLAPVPTCGPWWTIATHRGSTRAEPVIGLK